MRELRQSTQVVVPIGMAASISDGYTAVGGAASPAFLLANADEAKLLKYNGATAVDISGATWAAVPDTTTSPVGYVDGWYNLTLTTSHTDTLGPLTVVINDASLVLPIWAHFSVVTQNYWDSKYASDYLNVDVVQVDGNTEAAQKQSIAARSITTGTVVSSPASSTTTIYTDIVGSTYPADTFNGRVMLFYDNAAGLGEQAARITDFAVSGSPERGVFTVSGFTNAPSSGAGVVIL